MRPAGGDRRLAAALGGAGLLVIAPGGWLAHEALGLRAAEESARSGTHAGADRAVVILFALVFDAISVVGWWAIVRALPRRRGEPAG
jgi:hypothetical protein